MFSTRATFSSGLMKHAMLAGAAIVAAMIILVMSYLFIGRPDASAVSGDDEAFCQAFLAANYTAFHETSGGPDALSSPDLVEQMKTMERTATASIRPAVRTALDSARELAGGEMDLAAVAKIEAANHEIWGWSFENCAAPAVDVVATDKGLSVTSGQTEPGLVMFRFTNESKAPSGLTISEATDAKASETQALRARCAAVALKGVDYAVADLSSGSFQLAEG